MKDRIPLYPGRVKLTAVDGQPGVYDMVRADEATEQGTPLSKATLLDDDTAALYGLTGDAATVNNVLAKTAPLDVLKTEMIYSSQNWVAPSNIRGNIVFVTLFGGGGGGNGGQKSGSINVWGGGGGGSGYMTQQIHNVIPGQSYPVIIGAGGAGGTANSSSSADRRGEAGGTSSFDGQTATGGNIPEKEIDEFQQGNNGGAKGGEGGTNTVTGSAGQNGESFPSGRFGLGGEAALYAGGGGAGYGDGGGVSAGKIYKNAGVAAGGVGGAVQSGSSTGYAEDGEPGGAGLCIIEYYEITEEQA